MRIEGRYLDGRSSRRQAAVALVEDGLLHLLGTDGAALRAPVPLAEVNISSRVGNTPRHLRLPDGDSFESDDNDTIDALVARHRPARALLAHRLESRLRYVLIGLLATVAFVWGSVQWGVPALAKVAAHALPLEVNEYADRSVLALLDRHMLEPSKLPEAEQARLLEAFAPLVATENGQAAYRVLFRDAQDSIGANAMALPAGTIVFTDQLVKLAKHDEELVAVLAHEIGHVVERHAMRRSIQASVMGLLAALVVGDVSSVSSAVTALPLILTELGYSRAFEAEADRHAVRTLREHGIEPGRLADVLQRLDPSKSAGNAYLRTHPPTSERVRAIVGN